MTAVYPAAPAAALPPEAFTDEVRAVLDHLYDSAFLHNHPLAWRLCGENPTTGVTRAQHLRTLLLDAIEQLRPAGHPATDAMRCYAILTYRCMDSLSMDEIAARLGLSRRQTYRDYAKGIDAVTSFVWDALTSQVTVSATASARLPAPPLAAMPPLDGAAVPGLTARLDAAAQEVARLTTNLLLESVDLAAVVDDVTRLLAPRTQQTGVAVHVAPRLAPPPAVVADRAPAASGSAQPVQLCIGPGPARRPGRNRLDAVGRNFRPCAGNRCRRAAQARGRRGQRGAKVDRGNGGAGACRAG